MSKSTIMEKFWAKVNKTESCWLWTACIVEGGYGLFMADHEGNRAVLGMSAHRFLWEKTHGPIPKGLVCMHNCPDGDNPACVRPSHLKIGTQAENIADKVKKNRQAKGSRVNTAKLTESQVIEIRAYHALHPDNRMATLRHFQALGFNITRDSAHQILSGKTWKHV